MTTQPSSSSSGLEFRLHPLVLINVSDHHTRMRCNSRDVTTTVMGCLLGLQTGRVVDISNSFEVVRNAEDIDWQFTQTRLEQCPTRTSVAHPMPTSCKWCIDKTVFPDLDVIGWYCVGQTELCEQHMTIQRKMMEMNESPVFLMMNPTVDPLQKDLPVFLYETEVHLIDDLPSFIFVRAEYSIATEDAERVGVNQVAKSSAADGDKGSGQFVSHLGGLYSAVKMLKDRLAALFVLMDKMESGEVEMDHELMREIAGLAQKVPLLDDASFQQSFAREYNDALLTIHLAAITKGVFSANTILEKSQYLMERPRKKLLSLS